jgi:hypothetical protein
MDRNEMQRFINKVFTYYNGKINVINRAVLDINWANQLMCDAGGYSRLPNVVVINPMIISRFYEEDEHVVKVSIIETIIHELYHTDQLINYHLYTSDINYNQFIEHACQLQTTIYMTGHQQEIYNIFGVDISVDKNKYNEMIKYWYYPGVNYQRRYFHDHLFMYIDNLVGLGEQNGLLVHELILKTIDAKKDIILNINGEEICAYREGQPVDINHLNSKLIKYQCTGIYNPKFSLYYGDYDNMIIEIEIQVSNLMCKKV